MSHVSFLTDVSFLYFLSADCRLLVAELFRSPAHRYGMTSRKTSHQENHWPHFVVSSKHTCSSLFLTTFLYRAPFFRGRFFRGRFYRYTWTFLPHHWIFGGPIFRGLIFLVDVFSVAIFTEYPPYRDTGVNWVNPLISNYLCVTSFCRKVTHDPHLVVSALEVAFLSDMSRKDSHSNCWSTDVVVSNSSISFLL